MHMRRSERIKRQEFDDGGPDDIVFFGTEHRPTVNYRYHDDPDCHRLTDSREGRDTTVREKAQKRWMAPCGHCVIPTEPDHPARDCPYCGEVICYLPLHLTDCDAAQEAL